MKDQETVQKFIELRAQGWSFARIAAELGVAKRTVIEWSRRFLFEIHTAAPSASTLSLKFSKQVPFGTFWFLRASSYRFSYRFHTGLIPILAGSGGFWLQQNANGFGSVNWRKVTVL